MPDTVYVLTEQERKLLQKLLDDSRRRIQNTQGRGALGSDLYLTPEIHVARTGPDGIPAFDYAGTGTGTGTGSGLLFIVDNGDAGYSESIPSAFGDWGSGYQGDARYTAPSPNPLILASWLITGLTVGFTYRVSVTFPTQSNLEDAAAYTIYDSNGTTVLGTATANQRVTPSDLTANGATWKDLGNFTPSGTSLKVTLHNSTDWYVIADAVRVEALDSNCDVGEFIPGSADCEIYQLATESVPHRLVPLTRFVERVYNLSINAIPGCSFVIIERDKRGTWWVTESGSISASSGHWAVITEVSNKYASHEEVEALGESQWPTKSDGITGTINENPAEEYNEMAGCSVGTIVWLSPAQNGNWLYHWDRIPGAIQEETEDGVYTVVEYTIPSPDDWSPKNNGRIFEGCKDRNNITGLEEGTRVTLFRGFSAERGKIEEGTLWFEIEDIPGGEADAPCAECEESYINIEITDIDMVVGTTYNVYNTLTETHKSYKLVCYPVIGCMIIDLCTCLQVPWWCTPHRGCVQSVLRPSDAVGLSYPTRQQCLVALPCGTGTGTSTGSTPTVECTQTDCCDDPIPNALVVLFLNKTGSAVCLPDYLPMNKGLLTSNWTSDSITTCTAISQIAVVCEGQAWNVAATNMIPGDTLFDSVDCGPPILLRLNNVSTAGIAGGSPGTFDLVVTAFGECE